MCLRSVFHGKKVPRRHQTMTWEKAVVEHNSFILELLRECWTLVRVIWEVLGQRQVWFSETVFIGFVTQRNFWCSHSSRGLQIIAKFCSNYPTTTVSLQPARIIIQWSLTNSTVSLAVNSGTAWRLWFSWNSVSSELSFWWLCPACWCWQGW